MVRIAHLAFLIALGIASQCSPVGGQDDAQKSASQDEQPVVSLQVGDLAPELKVTKWLQGDAVEMFEPSKVYVVEFWAAWCGPCIGNMPHVAALQARYRDQGVTMIGVTCRDIRGVPNNTEEEVAAFVKKHGQNLRYTFAYADDSAMADTWLKAAGQEGFCTFVVDKAGRIAYMGHPMFLDLVLRKVVDGDASAKAVGDEMAEVVAEYLAMHKGLVRDFEAGSDLKPGLRALKEFEAKYPPLADMPTLVQAKLSLLPKHGDPGEGKKYAEAIVAKAIDHEDIGLLSLAYSILRDDKESQASLALARKVAEAHVRIDGGDAQGLLNLGEAYLVSGDKAQAKECAKLAMDAAAEVSPAFQQYVAQEARKLEAKQ